MTDAVRKPSRQMKISPEDRATFDALHSRDAAVRLAAASTPDLSARMIEEALTCHKDVRHAAMRNQRLHESQITYYLTKGSVEDRTLIIENQPMDESQLDPVIHHRSDQVRLALAKRPGLSARATFELCSDWEASVRMATIEHQKIEGLYLDVELQTSRGRELEAVIEHQSLTPAQVASLLEDRDPRVRLATVQYQGLTTDQAGRLLDLYATATGAIEQEIRRAAVDRAEPSRLQEATQDPDPVVSERARRALDDVAAGMVERITAASNLSSDDAEKWAQAGQREIDFEDMREAQATARDKEWGFDLAWAERAELISQVGSRPEDPQASLAALARDRDVAAERLARLQRSAGMLPLGCRGILDQHVADANAEATHTAAQVATVEQAIMNGSHPQVLACAKFDLEHGADAERIAELNRQCVQGLSALSKDDWTVAPLPTSEVAQAAWLRRYGEYAAAAARVERTGVVAEADVAARIAHHAMTADMGFRVSRGIDETELGLSYGF